MKTQSRGPNTMTGEGAEVEFLGEGFPAGAAAEMAARFATLNNPPKDKPKIKSQSIEEIPDVVVQSAFTLIEDEMQDDEAAFARAAEQPRPEANEEEAAIERTWRNLVRVVNDAVDSGFFTKIEVEKDTDELEASGEA